MASPTFGELEPACRALWAKSGTPTGHGLLCHMLDVAAVAREILARESPAMRRWLSESIEMAEDAAVGWVAAQVGLHDFGKAIPGFQAKWTEGRIADEAVGLSFKARPTSVPHHAAATAVLLKTAFESRFRDGAWISGVTMAQGAHHGYVPQVRELREARPRWEGPEWARARGALLDVYLEAMGLCDHPPPAVELQLPLMVWLAGLISVSDWIGSNVNWFPLGERGVGPKQHFAGARELASRALDAIHWPSYRRLLTAAVDSDAAVSRILGNRQAVTARPLQRCADDLLATASGPTLVIVEAPMGEGKTELALLAHLRLQATNQHRGLYLALPTQATGDAMFTRAVTFLRAFADGEQLDIQLVHGGAAFSEDLLHLRNIDNSVQASVASSAWFAQRKRPLLSPYGVGTVDQALFATLNVKHHFVRLWGLSNRVVVLDEIHAYDTYTSDLIAELLKWLKRVGSSVVLMSATLPARQRAKMLGAWDATDVQAGEVPYPRVAVTSASGTTTQSVPCRDLEPITIAAVAEDLGSLAETAVCALSGGGCGVVIVNTVSRAQALYRELQSRDLADADLRLFHARYPADERHLREKAVLELFGATSTRDRPARALLVATQVVEQSLDLDFDFMLTDLAPVDLLWQRAGRLHRRRRRRPEAHAAPRLTIAGLLPERLPDLESTAWGFVYTPYLLYRTWAFLRQKAAWQMPADIDRLVQLVYGNEPLPEAIDGAARAVIEENAYGEACAVEQYQRQLARNAAIEVEAEPTEAYAGKLPGDEDGAPWAVPAVTRLGEDSVTVIPVFACQAGWSLGPNGEAIFAPDHALTDELAKRIYARQVRLSRRALVRTLRAEPAPPCFEQHPLLQRFRPLVLRGDAAELGGLRVALDAELGITYEPLQPRERA